MIALLHAQSDEGIEGRVDCTSVVPALTEQRLMVPAQLPVPEASNFCHNEDEDSDSNLGSTAEHSPEVAK
jgi:hypothetical protein